VLSAVSKEPSPNRSGVARRNAYRGLAAAGFMLVVFAALGGMRAVERPLGFVLVTAAGWAAIAFAAGWSSARGRSMLGRPRSLLVGFAVLTPLALEAWYVCWSFRSSMPPVATPLLAAIPCAIATLAMGAAPLIVMMLARRGTDPVHPGATAAAMAAVAGASSAVLMDLHCERADLVHVSLGHVLPVLLLVCVGLALGGRWLGVRAEPSAGERNGARVKAAEP
jgi:hypothetical protein